MHSQRTGRRHHSPSRATGFPAARPYLEHAGVARRRTSGRYAFRASAAPHTQSSPRGVARCNPIPPHPSVGPTRPGPDEGALRASTEIPASQHGGRGVTVPQTQLSHRTADAARPPTGWIPPCHLQQRPTSRAGASATRPLPPSPRFADLRPRRRGGCWPRAGHLRGSRTHRREGTRHG